MVYAKSLLTNPAGRHRSGGFDEDKAGIQEYCGHVLIDAPPVELVSDHTIPATQSDGAVLVLGTQTPARELSGRACAASKPSGLMSSARS
jgi:hypothetical protein